MQHAENQLEFVAQGNEPFWSIATDGAVLRYSSPEHLDGLTVPATRTNAGDWTVFSAELEGSPLLLEVRNGQCFDDMSGLEFSHLARFSWNGGPWNGCARLSSEPQPTENTQ